MPYSVEEFKKEFEALPAAATLKDVEQIHRVLSLKAHPDRPGGTKNAQQNLNIAYEHMCSEVSSGRYAQYVGYTGVERSYLKAFLKASWRSRVTLLMQAAVHDRSINDYRNDEPPVKFFSYLLIEPLRIVVKAVKFVLRLMWYLLEGIRMGVMALMNQLTFGHHKAMISNWREEPAYKADFEQFCHDIRAEVYLRDKQKRGQIWDSDEALSPQEFYVKHVREMMAEFEKKVNPQKYPLFDSIATVHKKNNNPSKEAGLLLEYFFLEFDIGMSVDYGMGHIELATMSFWEAFKAARFSKPLIVLAALVLMPLFTGIQITMNWIVKPLIFLINTSLAAAYCFVAEVITLPIRLLDWGRSLGRQSTETAGKASPGPSSFLGNLGKGPSSSVPPKHHESHVSPMTRKSNETLGLKTNPNAHNLGLD